MKTNHLTPKRRCPALLLFVPALVLMAAGCNGSYNSGGGGNTPYISGLSVASGPVGTSVTITGTNFGATQGSSTVTFSGTLATPTNWSATSIVVPAPAGATSGSVVVTVGGKASNGMTFTVTAAASPSITSLSPTSGPVGTPVTITGTNFGATQGSSTVKFNGTTATPTSWSATSVVVPVPNGATTGYVVVTVGGVPSNSMTFTVTSSAPTITMLNPTSGQVGTSVTLTGTNFGAMQASSTVTFYNGKAATVITWSATGIVATVPNGATTGNVIVTVAGVASNGVLFTVNTTSSAPTIASLTPASGVVGTSVTIAGSNFGTSQVSSTVTFNGTTATPTNWGNTSIVAPVPTGATTGNVVVTVGGVASNGVAFTVTGSTTAKWPIKANGRYFTDSSTPPNPWIMVGDSAHHLINVLPMSSWSTYLSNRQSHGFNTVNIFSCGHGNCPSTGATANGQLPFTAMITSTCNGANAWAMTSRPPTLARRPTPDTGCRSTVSSTRRLPMA